MWPFNKKVEDKKQELKKGKLKRLSHEQAEVLARAVPKDIERHIKKQLDNMKNAKIHHVDYWRAFHYLEGKAGKGRNDEQTADAAGQFAYCVEAMRDGKEFVWICPECYKVIGFFSVPKAVDPSEYAGYVQLVLKKAGAERCPDCGADSNMLMRTRFLLSGETLSYAKEVSGLNGRRNGTLKAPSDEERVLEMMHMTSLQMGTESERDMQNLERKLHGKSFNDMVRERGLHPRWMIIKDGDFGWTAFGRFRMDKLRPTG